MFRASALISSNTYEQNPEWLSRLRALHSLVAARATKRQEY